MKKGISWLDLRHIARSIAVSMKIFSGRKKKMKRSKMTHLLIKTCDYIVFIHVIIELSLYLSSYEPLTKACRCAQ